MTTETPSGVGAASEGDGGGNETNNGAMVQQSAMDGNVSQNPIHPPSNGSEGNGGVGSTTRTDVCRDYMNNVCFRGNRCRFYHPSDVATNRDQGKEIIKDFCHDYQNRGCTRESCRYIHCGRDDMEEYNRTGRVTEGLARALVAVTGQEVVDGVPLCKEYLSGRCSRGARCRFWHINPRVEREHRNTERLAGGGMMAGYVPRGSGPVRRAAGGSTQIVGGYGGSAGPGIPGNYEFDAYQYGGAQPDYKRPRLDDGQGGTPFTGTTQTAPSHAAYMALQEENIALRRKIDILKQTVAELSAANDNMLAENSRLRAGLQVPSAGGASAVNEASLVGNMAAATALSGVLNSVTQTLAGQTATQNAAFSTAADLCWTTLQSTMDQWEQALANSITGHAAA